MADMDMTSVEPIFDFDLPDDLRERFDQLFERIYSFLCNSYRSEEEVRLAIQALQDDAIQEITQNPILAKVVAKDMLHWSLLMTICEKIPYWDLNNLVKFLIQSNPNALLGTENDGSELENQRYPLLLIMKDEARCALAPWIAKEFPWVFQHEMCQESPPHFNLVGKDENVIREFYEVYPDGLGEEEKWLEDGLPISKHLCGWDECSVELIIWLAKKYPESLLYKNCRGHVPLHMACNLDLETERETDTEPHGDNRVAVIQFLIEYCPASVRVLDGNGCLPIHFVSRFWKHPIGRKVMVALLRQYPESFDISTKKPSRISIKPSDTPFGVKIGKLLLEDQDTREELQNFNEIIQSSCQVFETMPTTFGNVFVGWLKLRAKTLEDRLNQIQLEVKQVEDEFDDMEFPMSDESSENDEDNDDMEHWE